MPSNKRVQFVETIHAPAATVFERMIDPESYKDWTAAFAEGSTFEGSWQRGERIRFLSPSGDGMLAEIAEHEPNQFLSIRHLGMITNGVEDTESEAIKAWAPAYENYTFEPVAEGTRLTVDQDVAEEWEAYMAEAWPKALLRLKAICEA